MIDDFYMVLYHWTYFCHQISRIKFMLAFACHFELLWKLKIHFQIFKDFCLNDDHRSTLIYYWTRIKKNPKKWCWNIILLFKMANVGHIQFEDQILSCKIRLDLRMLHIFNICVCFHWTLVWIQMKVYRISCSDAPHQYQLRAAYQSVHA